MKSLVLPVLGLSLLSLVLGGCKMGSMSLEDVELEFDLRRGKWAQGLCFGTDSAPIEIMQGLYYYDADLDHAPGVTGRFGKALDVRYSIYDPFGLLLDRFVAKVPMDRKTGVQSAQIDVDRDLIVPAGGEGCVDFRKRGGAKIEMAGAYLRHYQFQEAFGAQ